MRKIITTNQFKKDLKRVAKRGKIIQHFDPDTGDYTKERHQWLEKQSVEDVLAEMKKWKNTTNISSFIDNKPL